MNVRRCPTCGTAYDADAGEQPDGSVVPLVKQERDELLAALRAVCEVDHENAIDYVHDPERCGEAFAAAHALIARIEGGK